MNATSRWQISRFRLSPYADLCQIGAVRKELRVVELIQKHFGFHHGNQLLNFAAIGWRIQQSGLLTKTDVHVAKIDEQRPCFLACSNFSHGTPRH